MVVLTSFIQPTEGIRHRQQNTTVYVNDNNLGKGTLYIAESQLSWISESGNGFSIEYPHIALHAISRDLSAFPQECLFLMLDTALEDEEQNNGEEESSGDDKPDATELRLVPDDRGMLDAMFHAMNACQALHPDPEHSFSDEDFFEDAVNEIPLEETGSQMARLRIGNRDGRAYMEEGRVGDMGEDMEEDMLGIWGGTGAGRAGGILEDTEEDREADTEVGREAGMGVGISGISGIWGGMGADRVVGMEADRAAGILGDMGADRVVGMGAGRAAGILGGRGADRVVGMGAGRAAGILGGTGADRVVGMGVGRAAGILGIWGDREAGMGVGMGVGMEEDTSVYTGDRILRGDRSNFLGNTSHRNMTAGSPQAHSLHTVLDSHFDDAEN